MPEREARALRSCERTDGPAANDAAPERLQSRLMRIGIPRETKDGERRVGMTPDGARALVRDGHDVVVECGAGAASGFSDAAYAACGAAVVDGPDSVWDCGLVVKVKELQRGEYGQLRPHTTIFGFAQLNRDPALLAAILASGARVIACETVRDAGGALPLLAPMSRIAGRLAPLVGAQALQVACDGGGTMITGVDDVPAARVVVVGAGNAGREAARIAARLGCRVDVWSRGAQRLAQLAEALAQEGRSVGTRRIGEPGADLAAAIAAADLVIGAVLEPGKLSPRLISREMVRSMRRGSAIVDVGIDQGGIAETSRMTTLTDPTYVEEGVVHYAVPNLPALVPRTATTAFCAATLGYVRALAGRGIAAALDEDPGLAEGVMVWDGTIVHAGLAAQSNLPVTAAPWRTARAQPARVG